MGSTRLQYDCIKAMLGDRLHRGPEVDRPANAHSPWRRRPIAPIAASSVVAAKLMRDARLKIYPRLPHGMRTTHPGYRSIRTCWAFVTRLIKLATAVFVGSDARCRPGRTAHAPSAYPNSRASAAVKATAVLPMPSGADDRRSAVRCPRRHRGDLFISADDLPHLWRSDAGLIAAGMGITTLPSLMTSSAAGAARARRRIKSYAVPLLDGRFVAR